MVFLKLIRFPNLLIVAFTQYLLNYLVLLPALKTARLSPTLNAFHFFLFVLTTLIIAAGGYVINDLTDYKIDCINKPEKVIVNKIISLKTARHYYLALTIFGFVISGYLALYVNNLPLLIIYPIAVGLLYFYSRHLKKTALLGNSIVALFCAFVAGIVLFAERESYFQLKKIAPPIADEIWLLFLGYSIFALLSTLFREIVKDLEDRQGDLMADSKTLPIVLGNRTTKIIASFFAGLLLVLVVWFASWLSEKSQLPALQFTWAGIILPLLFSLFYLSCAKTKKQFHQLSALIKFIMLSGIILLIIIKL